MLGLLCFWVLEDRRDAYTRGRGRQLWLSVKGCLISREKGRLVAGNALYSGQRTPTKFPDFFVTCRALCLRFHCSARVTLAPVKAGPSGSPLAAWHFKKDRIRGWRYRTCVNVCFARGATALSNTGVFLASGTFRFCCARHRGLDRLSGFTFFKLIDRALL